jgi:hypothetical protein
MQRIREILLTEHIGAITIGFILAQAITGFVSTFVQSGAVYWVSRNTTASVFAGRQAFSRSSLVIPLIAVALYFLVAYFLMRWLYLQPKTQVTPATDESEDNSREQ